MELNPLEKFYTKGYFRASWKFQTDPIRLQEIFDKIMLLKPRSILDVGCGRGYLVKKLNEAGIPTKGLDFARSVMGSMKVSPDVVLGDALNLPFFDKSFELVVSTDFFEHIPGSDVDRVYDEMKRVGDRIAARIAFDGKENEYHLTVKPEKWWKNKFPDLILI